VLAYVFWHRPGGSVDVPDYERRLDAFHERLAAAPPAGFAESAAFRVGALPWLPEGGYEDWYLVDGWTAVGVLNDAAIDAQHRTEHDAVAQQAADGAGAVYRLLEGGLAPAGAGKAEWSRSAPADRPRKPDYALWQRQLVLGPAPEFCMRTRGSELVRVTRQL
jgi:hypothetical protein